MNFMKTCLIFGFFHLLMACGSGGSSDDNGVVDPDPIIPPESVQITFFTVSMSSITAGEISTLSWASENAEICNIGSELINLPVSGSADVSPSIDTQYQLTCTNSSTNTSASLELDIQVISVPNNPPVALFNATPNPTIVNSLISLDASGSNDSDNGDSIVSYAWNFDDGTTAIGVNTTHTYSNSGTYSVSLVVTDNRGASSEAFVLPIDVLNATGGNNPPEAHFNMTPNPAETDSMVTFDASSSMDPDQGDTIAQYFWNFDDGTTALGVNSTHVYSTAGTYNVSLVVTDNRGASSEALVLPIEVLDASGENNPPEAHFNMTPNPAEANSIVTFDASTSTDPDQGDTITQYSWDFGDSTTAMGVNTTHSYSASGTYNVSLVVTDNHSASSDTLVLPIVVSDASGDNNPPEAHFNVTPNPAEVDTNIIFDASTSTDPDQGDTITQYSWNFGNGNTSMGINTTHSYSVPGSYDVSLIVEDSSGNESLPMTLEINIVDEVGGGEGVVTIPPATPSVGPFFCPDPSLVDGGTTYYYCDCGAGANASCEAGDDNADGLSEQSPKRSYQDARAQFSNLLPGQNIAFCRGGSFSVNAGSTRWLNEVCDSEDGQRCTVRDYGDSNLERPLIDSTGGHNGFTFDSSGQQQGFNFLNLKLRGTGGKGFRFLNNIDDVMMCNLQLDGFRQGVETRATAGGEGELINSGLILRNSVVINSVAMGWLGSCSECAIEGSHFESNGTNGVFDHNIYLSSSQGHGVRVDNMRVQGNTLYRSTDKDPSGVCVGVSLVAHGTHAGLLIEGNVIWEDLGTVAGSCGGIHLTINGPDDVFTDAVIRGNTLVNMGANSYNKCNSLSKK